MGPGDPQHYTSLLTTKSHAVVLGGGVGSPDDLTVAWPGIPFARRIYVGGAGNVLAKKKDDTAYTTYAVLAGSYLDGAWIAVASLADGTTATGLIAEY